MRPGKRYSDYGTGLAGQCPQSKIEAICCESNWPVERGGLGAYEHFRRFIALLWPSCVTADFWHPWSTWRFKSLMDGTGQSKVGGGVEAIRFTNMAWTGCATSGKSYDAALFAFAWFMLDPDNTSVILTSTSKKMIRKRMWPVIQTLRESAVDSRGEKWSIGHMLDSQTTLQSKPGDDKHAIFALAVERRELATSIGTMKGIHAPRMMVVVDEAETTPPAIFETLPNLRKGCSNFMLLTIGNSVSPLDPHGRICEPRDEWDSVSVDSTEWPTKGVVEWDIDPGHCMHFDGKNSPNVVAGKTRWTFLYSFENWQKANSNPDYVNSLGYWSQERGWWPPEGAVNRILSPQIIVKNNARSQFTWINARTPMACLDPAFGGDKAIYQSGERGLIEGVDGAAPREALQIREFIEVTPKVTSPDEIDFQIADRCIEENKKRGVKPIEFGIDSTGSGRGVASIIAQRWGAGIHRVEFGARASLRTTSIDDLRPAAEMFGDFVSEMWWAVREFTAAGLIRGFYDEIITQFTSREYILIAGRKIKMLDKMKTKQRTGKSPDHADAVAILLEVARRNGMTLYPAHGGPMTSAWKRVARRAANVYTGGYASATK